MSYKAISVLLGALLLVGGGAAFYLAGQEPGPLLTVRQPTAIGGGQITLELSVDSDGTRLSRAEARLEQSGLQFQLFSLSEPGDAQFVQENPGRMRITRVVATSTLKGLRDGPARVVVTAAHPVLFGMRQVESTVSRDVRVRLTPPRLSIASTRHYVNLGGAELVVYRVSPPDVASGVQVGDRYYPGFAASGVGGAIASDPGLRLAFFALLFDQDAKTPTRVVARDEAGNSTSVNLAHTILPGTFAESRAPVDDRFLRRVVAPILKATPDLKMPDATPGDRLAAFLVINGELRRKNSSQIEAIGHDTVPEMLWRGPFRRMGRAKPGASFADHRTYMYDGGEIDQQVHLGADLASTRRAPVTAAGRVLFAPTWASTATASYRPRHGGAIFTRTFRRWTSTKETGVARRDHRPHRTTGLAGEITCTSPCSWQAGQWIHRWWIRTGSGPHRPQAGRGWHYCRRTEG